MISKSHFTLALLFLSIAALSCNLSAQRPPPTATDAVVDLTKVALEVESTTRAKFLTEQAAAQPPSETPQPQVQPPEPAATETETQPAPPPNPTETSEPEQPPAPEIDIESKMKDAKILVYEDAGSAYLGQWVKSTLDLMGLRYIHVGDAIGDFMSRLNSGTRWDLIIVAAESRKGVQGEFWDVITPKVTADKSALIVEMWYLSQIANGRIQSLTSKCGIAYQSTRKFVDSIYTLDSSNPIFTTPNNGFSLTNYVGYWKDKGGDYVRLTGGDATLLAGGFLREKSRYGLITSCIDGRVIIQTFSTHDYSRERMQMLWENYITNTLTNHFKAIGQ